MKKTMIAAVGLCGLLFAGAANAAVATPDTAPATARPAAGLTQVAETVIIRHRGPGWHHGRDWRRPMHHRRCRVVVSRHRTPHGWVTKRVRRCW